MGRMTEYRCGEVYINKKGFNPCNEFCHADNCNYCTTQKAFIKLAHYEDLEEQGRLHTCKFTVGDEAYFLRPSRVIEEYIVLEVNVSKRGITYWRYSYGRNALFNEKDIGETWFLTKEEAEAKLRELNTHERE